MYGDRPQISLILYKISQLLLNFLLRSEFGPSFMDNPSNFSFIFYNYNLKYFLVESVVIITHLY